MALVLMQKEYTEYTYIEMLCVYNNTESPFLCPIALLLEYAIIQ